VYVQSIQHILLLSSVTRFDVLSIEIFLLLYSKSHGKADYIEGGDDSGVTSSRFVEELFGTPEHGSFFGETKFSNPETKSAHLQLLENCLALGSPCSPQIGLEELQEK
jgi:hypothetical protein